MTTTNGQPPEQIMPGREGVLPYFRKLERDLDFQPNDMAPGADPDSTHTGIRVAGIQPCCGSALARAGFARIDDQNDEFEPGYFPITINNEHDRRVSTAAGYLGADVRQRPNLTIFADTEARRVCFDGVR
ncbi:MAG: GMC family oxidoreductase N-terminal domain-containing protein [Thermomicrobiales bacterium]